MTDAGTPGSLTRRARRASGVREGRLELSLASPGVRS